MQNVSKNFLNLLNFMLRFLGFSDIDRRSQAFKFLIVFEVRRYIVVTS